MTKLDKNCKRAAKDIIDRLNQNQDFDSWWTDTNKEDRKEIIEMMASVIEMNMPQF